MYPPRFSGRLVQQIPYSKHTINNSNHWALTKWQHRHCCADDRAKLMTVWWIHLIFSRPRCRRTILHLAFTHQNVQFAHTKWIHVYCLVEISLEILWPKGFGWLVCCTQTKEAKITHQASHAMAKCCSRKCYCYSSLPPPLLCFCCCSKLWYSIKFYVQRFECTNMVIIFSQLKLYLKCCVSMLSTIWISVSLFSCSFH